MKLVPFSAIVGTSVALLAPIVASAQGQPARGGQGEAVLAPADAKVLAQVRVPVAHANIHSGPSTGNEVIVLAAKGTVMPMVGRRGEWIQLQSRHGRHSTHVLPRAAESAVTSMPIRSKRPIPAFVTSRALSANSM